MCKYVDIYGTIDSNKCNVWATLRYRPFRDDEIKNNERL